MADNQAKKIEVYSLNISPRHCTFLSPKTIAMCKQCYLSLFFVAFTALAFAQRPNSALRLPASPDMPDWARQIYRDDVAVNVFALDAAFLPWKTEYETLKREITKAGAGALEAKKERAQALKKYYKYYTRWRNSVRPFVQPDGSLLFDAALLPDVKPKNEPPASAESSMTWTFLGPMRTKATVNDNPAQPLVPWQANIYTLAIAPSNSNVLLYGTETGLVGKSTNKGLTWTTLGLNYFVGPNMRGAAIHPSNTNIFYIGDNNGVHTSTNGGTTWSQALFVGGFNCNDIKIKPNEPEVVLAAGSSLRRRTAGNVWTTILYTTTYDLAFHTNSPNVVYALVKNPTLDSCEFWKSTDGGQTFSVRPTGWITGLTDGGGRIAVTPADSNRVYCVLITNGGPRVMRSDNQGETWTVQASSSNTDLIGPCTSGALSMANGQGYYDLSIMASPTNADHLIVATTSAFKSTDGGTTYAPLGGYCGPFKIHPDIQEMTASGGDSWITTDGGINYPSDFFTNTANHSARINQMGGTDFWGFDQGWNEDVLVGGRYHNGNTAWRESYPAGDFLLMGGGESATGYLNPANAGMAYFSDLGGKILPATFNGSVSNFGVSKFPNEFYWAMEYSEQKWDPRYANTYYIGNGDKLWKTTDNGASFTAIFTYGNPDAKVQHIEVSRSDPNVIYITIQQPGDGRLWKTTDGGANWTPCNDPPGLTGSQRQFSNITLSGTNANTIWWAFRDGPNGSKIFKSTNGGAIWTNVTTAALNGSYIADLVHQLGTNDGVYLCADNGKVWYRNASMGDWTLYNTGLPISLVIFPSVMRMKPFYKGGKLRMATSKGIWEVDFFENSTFTLVQPMSSHAITACPNDTIQLESYSVIRGAADYIWSLSPAPQWISNAYIRNPRVVLGNTPGFYSANLTVIDDNFLTSVTVNDFINHLPNGNLCPPDIVPGKALQLDGDGDFAEANSSLNFNATSGSFTAWIKRNGAQDFLTGIVFERGTGAAGISINSDNTLRVHWNNVGWWLPSDQEIPDNEWTHVAGVVTPTTITLYVNGIGTTHNIVCGTEPFNGRLRIGSDAFGGRDFDGQIDEATVWNVALTQNQIRELMHLTLDPTMQPNLIAYYQCNEPSGVITDKVAARHASLGDNAARVVSTGPFGGGTSSRQTITTGGLKTFPGTDVELRFPATGTYPDGEIVVNRLNVVADSLPDCSGYASDNHYWIIDNYGTNQTFSPLDSMKLGNISVPPSGSIPPTAYQLNRRTAHAHLLPWTLQPGASIGATSGAGGNIVFGDASGVTQFGQFVATYNAPSYSNACTSGDFIDDFTFAGFSNLNTGCANPGSSNLSSYLGTGPSVTTNTSYPVSVGVGPNYGQWIGVYIDFNGNGSYLDAGEFFDLGLAPANGSVMGNIMIPANATLGAQTMRVRCSYDGALTAADGCSTNLTYGETEDYNIFIFCPSQPAVNAPTVTQPNCAVPTGTIVVNASSMETMEFSVDNGANWQASATFPGLAAGNYNLRARVQADPTCFTAYTGNPVVLNASTPPTYSNQCTSGDFIEDFTFGAFSNLGTGCANPGSSNLSTYFGTGPNVQVGETYAVTVKAGPIFAQYVGLYIDFNSNGSYLDAGEFFNIGQAPANGTVMANVLIPAGTTLGTKTMRVRCSFDDALTAADGCGTNLVWGEIEDYNIYLFCPNNLAVNDVPILDGTYNADQEITSMGTVPGGGNVTFSVGMGVLLQPNFEVLLNGVFTVVLASCFP
jgi:photosystem II stability/assembly factor-like uncharacterized protein